MIKSEATLKMSELKLTKRTQSMIQSYEFTPEDLVQVGRTDAYKLEIGVSSRIPNWRIEVAKALDAAGYIRHDITENNLFLLDQFRQKAFEPKAYTALYLDIKQLVSSDEAYTGPLMGYETQAQIVKKHLSTITEREGKIIKLSFGIDCKRPYSYTEIGDYFGSISKQRIQQIEATAYRKLKYRGDLIRVNELIQQIELCRQNSDTAAEQNAITELQRFATGNYSLAAQKATKYLLNQEDYSPNKDIRCLQLSVRAYNKLHGLGIDTIGQLLDVCHDGSIKSMLGSGYKTFEEITERLTSLNLIDKGILQPAPELEQLQLPTRAYNCLLKAGFTTLTDLAALTRKDLESIPGLSYITIDKIETRLHINGYTLKDKS